MFRMANMNRMASAFLVAVLSIRSVVPAAAQSMQPMGQVVITYEFARSPHVASNQIAVRIEDGEGRFVRTVYISDFDGRREGWRTRAPNLQNWVKASNAAGTSKAEIDAASGIHTP